MGLLFPVIGWIISAGNMNLPINPESIAIMHKAIPALWIIDIIPIFLFVISLLIFNIIATNKKQFEELSKDIERQKNTINEVATFAEKIGNGEYDYKFETQDQDNALSSSIIDLRDKLYENNKKESIRNWMMVGRDKISNILRLHNDLKSLSYEVLVNLIKYINVIQGAFYIYSDDKKTLNIEASYAYNRKKYLQTSIKIGEGLVGQAAIEQDIVYRTEIPDEYVSITSGILGDKKPSAILIVPLITEEKLQGAVEFASFSEFSDVEIDFLKEVGEIIARAIYNLKITSKTEKLLEESQQMTAELRENEEMLRQNAEEMKLTQEELEKTNQELESKIEEVNQSQKRLYSLLENASELILIYDENKKLKYVSPSVIRILGYDEEEMMSGKDFDRVNFKGQQTLDKLFEDLLKFPDKSQIVEYTYLHKDGAKIFLETTGRNLLKDPAINGLILNTRDITERKRAEKEQRMRGQMQSLSENSPDIIIRMDTRGQIFYHNRMIEVYTGIKSEKFSKKNINETEINQKLKDAFKNLISKVSKTEKKIQDEIEFQAHDGSLRIMNINAIPEFSEEKKLETILFVLHDITERKQIELMIQDKNRKITESINYAHRIQECILPNNKILQKTFKQSFIFYKPRDIVSGDFPWYYEKGDDYYIAAIDCTGHGVPGAMLSMIGYFIMNQILSKPENLNPGQILGELHQGVIETLRQDQEDANARDGMDMALCKINLKNKTIEFSGAHRPLYLVKNTNGELIEIKGTRSAIGGIPREGLEETTFKNHELAYEKGDTIYFFSDGLPDQFGGPNSKKYSPKRIKQHVTENFTATMPQIHKLFKNDHEKWMENEKAIDDVLMIGIRF